MNDQPQKPIAGEEIERGDPVQVEAGVARVAKPDRQRVAIRAGGTPAPIIPRSIDEVGRLANVIFESKLAPYGLNSVAAVGVAIMYGAELGLPPMAAIRAIAVINGRPSIYGDAGVAIIRGSGELELFEERFEGKEFEDDFKAVCRVKRKGVEHITEEEFSVADAKRAHLWDKRGKKTEKNPEGETPWVTYPKRMLKWRARSFAFRDLFADLLSGLIFAEEAADIEAEPEPEVMRASVVSRLPGPAEHQDNGHAEREINGHAEDENDAGADSASSGVVDTEGEGEQGNLELPKAKGKPAAEDDTSDTTIIGEWQGAIAEATTPEEVAVLQEQFGSLQGVSGNAHGVISKLLSDRADKLAVAKKKRAASTKL